MPDVFEYFETADDIPEQFRETAIETKDGKFAVAAGALNALGRERGRAEEMERKAKAEAKRAREYETRLAALEEERQANAAGLTKDKLDEIRRQAEAKYAADLAERDSLKQKVRALTLDTTVKSLLAKAEFVDVDEAWTLFQGQFDLTDDLTPIVKADPAKALERHIADLAAAKPHLVKGTQASGGAARGNAAGGRPGAGEDVFQWTGEQRADFVTKHGAGAYQEKLDAAVLARATKQAA